MNGCIELRNTLAIVAFASLCTLGCDGELDGAPYGAFTSEPMVTKAPCVPGDEIGEVQWAYAGLDDPNVYVSVSASGPVSGELMQTKTSAQFVCADTGTVTLTITTYASGGSQLETRSIDVECARCPEPPTAIELIADATLDNIIQSTLDDFDATQCSMLANDDAASDLVGYAVREGTLDQIRVAVDTTVLDPAGNSVADPSQMPCDDSNVECGGDWSALQADARVVYAHMRKAEPTVDDDGNCRFESLVLETDGDTANDWVPQGSFGCDYYQGTDTWLQMDKDPSGQWSAGVQQVSDSQSAAPADVAYRILRDGADTHIFLDASSFASPRVSARVVTFNDPSCSFDFAQLHGDVSGDSPQAPPTLAGTLDP